MGKKCSARPGNLLFSRKGALVFWTRRRNVAGSGQATHTGSWPEFFEELFARFGCGILVVNRAEDASSAQELAEDLVSIVQHFAARLYGQRTYRARKLVKKVREALADAADGEAEEPAAERRKVGQAAQNR